MDPTQKLEDALNQLAAETIRADEAEKARDAEKQRADAAEAKLQTSQESLAAAEKARSDAADGDKEQLRRQCEALKARVAAEKARADRAESDDFVSQRVAARVQLIGRATAIMGGDASRFDKMTDRQVMSSVIEKLRGGSVDGKSDDYVRARFDSLAEAHAIGTEANARVRQVVEDRAAAPANRADARSPRAKFLDEQANLWRQPAGAGAKEMV